MRGLRYLAKREISFRDRIIVVYSLVFMIIFTLIGIPTYFGFQKVRNKEVGSMALQTITALDNNLISNIDNIKKYTDIFFLNPSAQKQINQLDQSDDRARYEVFNNILMNIILSNDDIGSVYFFDRDGRHYSAFGKASYFVGEKNIEECNWYKQVMATNDVIYALNGGGIIGSTSTLGPFISFFIKVNSIKDFGPVGILAVNIDTTEMQKKFRTLEEEYNSQFFIVNNKNEILVNSGTDDRSLENIVVNEQLTSGKYKIIDYDSKQWIIAKVKSNYSDWSLIGITPINEYAQSLNTSIRRIIETLGLGILLIFVAGVYISHRVSRPILKMQKHMKLAEKGEFVPIKVDPYEKDEIAQFKRAFNTMVASIDELIKKIKQEENIIRRNEVALFQAQIKPHFLYNTLDAISTLCLIEEHDAAYQLTQALGGFYRTSLSSGFSLITIQEELECVKNYMTILNVRYNNKLQVAYDIQEGVENQKILKLIIQPIVENAVYHGIRQKQGAGNIQIKIRIVDEIIYIHVIDDGIGIQKEHIQAILNKKIRTNKSGFGIYSLIEKISLFYDLQNPISIHSEVGEGTEMVVKLKVLGENVHDY